MGINGKAEASPEELEELKRLFKPRDTVEDKAKFKKEMLMSHFRKAEPEKPLPKQQIIHIGILSHDYKIFSETFESLVHGISQCGIHGIAIRTMRRDGDSMVARGRSYIASQFLEHPDLKDCTDLVFVDTDLAWEKDEFIELVRTPVDVLAGAYPYKDEHGNFPCRWGPMGIVESEAAYPELVPDKEGKPVEVMHPVKLWEMEAVTPGFMKISRRCLERIVMQCPWIEYHDNISNGAKNWMFFDNKQRLNGVYDEGYVFCEYARQCGFKPYVAPDWNFTHIGMKRWRAQTETLRGWLADKHEKVEKLYHEMPNIPPLDFSKKLDGIMLSEKKDFQREGNANHTDARPDGDTSGNGQAHAAEHKPGRYEGPDLRGPGRQADLGCPEAIAAGQPNNCISKGP